MKGKHGTLTFHFFTEFCIKSGLFLITKTIGQQAKHGYLPEPR